MKSLFRSNATIDTNPLTNNSLHNCPSCRCKSTDLSLYSPQQVESSTTASVRDNWPIPITSITFTSPINSAKLLQNAQLERHISPPSFISPAKLPSSTLLHLPNRLISHSHTPVRPKIGNTTALKPGSIPKGSKMHIFLILVSRRTIACP